MPQDYGLSQFGPEIQMALLGLATPTSMAGQAMLALSEALRPQTPPGGPVLPSRPARPARPARPQDVDLSVYPRDQLVFWSQKYRAGGKEYNPDIINAISREFQRRETTGK